MKQVKLRPETSRRIIIPEVTEQYVKQVPYEIWMCDFCNTQLDYRLTHCDGCGRDACDSSKHLKEFEFEIGYAGYSSDSDSFYDEDPSDDYRFARIYLCKDCIDKPPEKLNQLMKLIDEQKRIQAELDIAVGKIIDEIEDLNHKGDI